MANGSSVSCLVHHAQWWTNFRMELAQRIQRSLMEEVLRTAVHHVVVSLFQHDGTRCNAGEYGAYGDRARVFVST
jgi:hypothetical protein